MKPNLFLASVLCVLSSWCLPEAIRAQGTPATPASPQKIGDDPHMKERGKEQAGQQAPRSSKMESSGTFNLAPAALGELVAQVQQSAAALKDPTGAEVSSPNVVFAPGTQDIPVAAVRLRNVTPVQALALLAAAAGCYLEPITAPQESGAAAAETGEVIGYRFTTTPMTQIIYGGKSPGRTMVTTPSPRSDPNSATGLIVVEKPATSLDLIRVPGADVQRDHGSGSRGHAASPGEVPATAAVAAPRHIQAEGDFTALSSPFLAAKPDEPSVRVYALGSVLRGTPDEMKEKQVGVQSLALEAIERAGLLSEAQPHVSFHPGTKTLIVKANAAQHEIIDQIMKALKENEQTDAEAAASRK